MTARYCLTANLIFDFIFSAIRQSLQRYAAFQDGHAQACCYPFSRVGPGIRKRGPAITDLGACADGLDPGLSLT